jgi:DNA polymerase III alpha subunit
MVHPYLKRRKSSEPVSYPSREVAGVLQRTLGVPIFQEQVMQLAIAAAGFTPGEADALRRAMGAWKRTGGIEHFREKLIGGMRARGYAEEFAQRLYQQMLGFGEYGFPECVVGGTRVLDADTGRWLTIDEIVSGRARIRTTLACDEELRLRKRQVLAVRASGERPVWRLKTALGHSIVATAEHPFMTPAGWCHLGKLKVGDRVAAAPMLVEPLQLIGSKICWDTVMEMAAVGRRETYDLQIEENHNFLANNLVVHNSHSASFALLAYDSAWLKCHEPAAFTAALLNSQPMGFYAPAQLVRDARAHGVEVRPVDVCVSVWDCTLERREEDDKPVLRLGLRLVKSLSNAGTDRLIEARRQQPFGSVQDLAARAALDRGDLEALAAAGAFASLSGNRHLAFWEVAGTERPLPLEAARVDAPHEAAHEPTPLLRTPTEGERIVADYASVGLTLGRHPLALLRDSLQSKHLFTARDLEGMAHGKPVRTAGIVLMRQRPGTASGVTFLTLEDETGQVNIIVWERIGDEYRRPLVESRLLEVHGELQRQEGVMHVVARRLIDRSPLLGQLITRSRDFH